MGNIIGRETEIEQLNNYINSGRAEFIAIYGRRRIGKTFLIRQLYGNRLTFDLVGVLNGNKADQMRMFSNALNQLTQTENAKPKDWYAAFDQLRSALEVIQTKGPKILFIDELPCFDTHLSSFIKAFEHFWNSWAGFQNDIKLIVCGSATSWMIKNIIDSKGGLHNRITHEIHLMPFCLNEVETYLKAYGFKYNRISILQLYMALGGVPYYFSLLDNKKSAIENINHLFFESKSLLSNEFTRLFNSLFKSSEPYVKVIEMLANKKEGLTRKEIATADKDLSGGYLTNLLADLENCDFIRSYNNYGKKMQKNNKIYQLTDCFTLFFLTFCHNKSTDPNYWIHQNKQPKQNTWYGLAFERVCMLHIPQIKHALRIDRISCEYYSWRSKAKEQNAQIDLVLDRADDMLNICELKYSQKTYTLDKDEWLKLNTRSDVFMKETKHKSGQILTLITTFGLTDGGYASEVESLTMDCLFEKLN